MNQLQLREKEIFETLRRIRDNKFVLIGGYAVNTYALPRFSVDCDIVVNDDKELKKIESQVKEFGYIKKELRIKLPYHKEFMGYEKKLKNNFRVTMDILFNRILDRQTGASFEASWVFDNSKIRLLRGKTITEQLKLNIINPDALIVMKIASCRSTDIRDVFMLVTHAEDISWIRNEVAGKCDFKERFEKIKNVVNSISFKNNLQGVYGYVDEKTFERHKKAVLDIGEDK